MFTNRTALILKPNTSPLFLYLFQKKEASILGIADISKFTDPGVIQTVK
jgi:hypothetical protein